MTNSVHSEMMHSVEPAQVLQHDHHHHHHHHHHQQEQDHVHQISQPMSAAPTDTLVNPPCNCVYPRSQQQPFSYTVYTTPMDVSQRVMQTPTAGPPQTWQGPNGIAPQQTHMAPPPPSTLLPRDAFRDNHTWTGANYHQAPPPTSVIVPNHTPEYEYPQYRDSQGNWAPPNPEFYSQQVRNPVFRV